MITDYINRFGVNLAPTPKNDAKLLELVKVRVLKPFGLGADRIAQLGEIVELPRFDAQSLAAIGKCEVLK